MPRDQVFISYSHKDRKWRNDLDTHLKPYLRGGSIVSWSDQEIAPGSEWFKEIQSALANSKVAVLLVSAHFLASDFIHEEELGPLLKEAEKGGVRILWVPLYASAYKKTALEKYQAPLSPETPLAGMTAAKRAETWVRICEEIQKAVHLLKEPFPEDRLKDDSSQSAPPVARKLELSPAKDEFVEIADRLDVPSSPAPSPNPIGNSVVVTLSAPTLIEEIGTLSTREIAEAFFDQRWTLPGIRKAFAGQPDRVLELICNLDFGNCDEWKRGLVGYIVSQIQPPTSELISLAFNNLSLFWGRRLEVLSLLRFITPERRRRAERELSDAASKSHEPELDVQRLRLFALGCVEGEAILGAILSDYSVYTNPYYYEKLAYYAVEAFLRVYLRSQNERTSRMVLHKFTRVVEANPERGENNRFDYHYYLPRFTGLGANKAVALFRHLRDHGHILALQGFFPAFMLRPNPLLLSELIGFAESTPNPEAAAGALAAAAHVGTALAEQHLRKCEEKRLPRAQEALALVIGWVRDENAKSELESIIAAASAECRTNGLWAAGEVGRKDPAFARRLFEPLRDNPDDGYIRALAILGLAKANLLNSSAFEQAMEAAPEWFEKFVLALSGPLVGCPKALSQAINAMVENFCPCYRLPPHIHREFRTALREHAGTAGKELLTVLDMSAP